MPRVPLIKKLDLYSNVQVGTSDPSTGETGDLFYNTTSSTLKIYILGSWVDIGSGGVVVDGVYLAENSDYLLTEAGDYLAIE
jgi:hypothetical protein